MGGESAAGARAHRVDAPDDAGWQRLLDFLGEHEQGVAYEKARARLVDFFRWRGLTDPEDAADRTFDRVARKLASGTEPTTDTPLRYLLGVARFVYLEEKKRAPAQHELVEANLPAPEGDPAVEMTHRQLEICLGDLHPNERELLLRYHADGGQARIRSRKGLAEELGVTLTSLRMRIFRLRRRLELCLKRHLDDETDRPEEPPQT